MYEGEDIHDGPTLATDHVRVAMGAGASPLALESADIGILKPDLPWVLSLIRLGRIVRRRIRANPQIFADRGGDYAQCRSGDRCLELGTALSLEPIIWP